MKSKILQFMQTSRQSSAISFALLVLRVVAGAALAIHGWGKIQNATTWMGPTAPVPGFFQFLAAFSEFGGGLAWILGALTSLASLGVLITMLVAVLTHLLVLKDPFVDPAGGHSAELAFAYLTSALLLMLTGAGKISIDAKLFGVKKDLV